MRIQGDVLGSPTNLDLQHPNSTNLALMLNSATISQNLPHHIPTVSWLTSYPSLPTPFYMKSLYRHHSS